MPACCGATNHLARRCILEGLADRAAATPCRRRLDPRTLFPMSKQDLHGLRELWPMSMQDLFGLGKNFPESARDLFGPRKVWRGSKHDLFGLGKVWPGLRATRLDLGNSGGSPRGTCLNPGKFFRAPRGTCLDTGKSGGTPRVTCLEALSPVAGMVCLRIWRFHEVPGGRSWPLPEGIFAGSGFGPDMRHGCESNWR